MRSLLLSGLITCMLLVIMTSTVHANPYYIAPDKDLDGSSPNIQGSDTNNGLSPSSSLKTFSKAWEIIKSKHVSGNTITQPVTIILLDGIYLQSINPYYIEGSIQNRLTIKSANDGKAIIDGQYTKRPIYLNHWSANDGFTIEGLVARNSLESVVHIPSGGSHITLRRISAYNASNTKNHHVFSLTNINNSLIEDVVAAGTGRKMVMIFGTSDNVTLRRVFALHGGWKGGDPSYVPGWWPQTDGIEFYGSRTNPITNNTMENLINFGGNSSYGISLAPNPTTVSNVQVLGSIGIYGGKNAFGTSLGYVDNRCDPSNSNYTGCYPEWTQKCVVCGQNTREPSIRTGFTFGHWANTDQIFQNNIFQDLLGWGNLGAGLATGAPWNSASSNNVIKNVTFKGNNNGSPSTTDPGAQVKSGSLRVNSVTDSDIDGYTEHSGKGARLTHRYVNRQLTNEPLWPWPMEQRIKDEFARELSIQNFSVTCQVGSIINAQTKTPITYLNVNSYCNGTATPPPTVSPTPTSIPSPTVTSAPSPTPIPGCLINTNSWTNTPISPNQDTFTTTFDAIPTQDNLDSVIGLSQDTVSDYSQLAAIVRFNDAGQIDARNANTYQADASVSYTANTRFTLKLEVNHTTKTYHVWVTPQGGNPTQIASNYAFRTEQQSITQINNWAAFTKFGSINICDFAIQTTYDLNQDGNNNILDATFLITKLFTTDTTPAMDIDDDGNINILDLITLIKLL